MSLQTKASLILTPSAYKEGKLYSILPSNGNGDMTVVRATTATNPATRANSRQVIESVGNHIPRLNYDALGSASILLEPQRTNFIAKSEEFDSGTWGKVLGATVTANTVISPTGTLNGDTITFDGTANGQIQQGITKNIGETYTFSLWIKSNLSTSVNLYIGNDFSAVLVSTNWTRVSITKAITSTSATPKIVSSLISSFDIWGAQLEQGAYPTSYIPTTTTALTRNADVLSRDNIYTNGLITSAGGTWFVELDNNIIYTRDTGSSGMYLSSLNSAAVGAGAAGDTFAILRSSVTNNRLQIIKQTNLVFTVLYVTATDKIKVAIKWNGATADIFVNGIKQVLETAFTPTVMNFLNLSAQDVLKNIKSTMLFPTPLTDAECATLTTL